MIKRFWSKLIWSIQIEGVPQIAVIITCITLAIFLPTARAQNGNPAEVTGIVTRWSNGYMSVVDGTGETLVLYGAFKGTNTQPALGKQVQVTYNDDTKRVLWAKFDVYPFVRQAYEVNDVAWPTFESARRTLRTTLANDGWHNCFVSPDSKKYYCEREK